MQKGKALLAITSGLILALAMPQPGFWPLAWVGLVPLFIALRDARPREAAAYGLICGLVYFGIILYWIWLFGYLPWVLLAIVQGLFYAAFAAVACVVLPSRIGWWGYAAVPAAWTVMQWSRSLGVYGFPWGGLAHTQAGNLSVAQLASVTGVWGIEFVLCAFSLAAAAVLFPPMRKRRLAPGIVALGLVVAIHGVGFMALRAGTGDGGSIRVAVIQPNTAHGVVPEPGYAEDAFDVCERLSLEAARDDSDIIVWPESTLATEITDAGYGGRIANLARKTDADYLVGGYDPASDPEPDGSYNAAHLYARDGAKAGVYRKVHLVPFGEFVPLRDRLAFFDNYRIREEDVTPADSHVLLDSSIGKIGVSICFESLFPQISRAETRDGASVLFVTTNDSWFEHTQAARQHLMMSKLRAIENRRYVVRAALTGISAIIDPYGRTVTELGVFERGIVSGTVAPLHTVTLFTRLGQWFAYVCCVIVVGSLAARWAAGARHSRRVGRTTRAPRLSTGKKS